MKTINKNVILSFSIISLISLFCFIIGGTYNLHRIAMAFTLTYFVFVCLIPKIRISKILSIIFLAIGLSISLLNWFITGIPEPSNLFRIFTGDTCDIAMSQLSSILNVLMIATYNIVLLIFKKRIINML